MMFMLGSKYWDLLLPKSSSRLGWALYCAWCADSSIEPGLGAGTHTAVYLVTLGCCPHCLVSHLRLSSDCDACPGGGGWTHRADSWDRAPQLRTADQVRVTSGPVLRHLHAAPPRAAAPLLGHGGLAVVWTRSLTRCWCGHAELECVVRRVAWLQLSSARRVVTDWHQPQPASSSSRGQISWLCYVSPTSSLAGETPGRGSYWLAGHGKQAAPLCDVLCQAASGEAGGRGRGQCVN